MLQPTSANAAWSDALNDMTQGFIVYNCSSADGSCSGTDGSRLVVLSSRSLHTKVDVVVEWLAISAFLFQIAEISVLMSAEAFHSRFAEMSFLGARPVSLQTQYNQASWWWRHHPWYLNPETFQHTRGMSVSFTFNKSCASLNEEMTMYDC